MKTTIEVEFSEVGEYQTEIESIVENVKDNTYSILW